MRKTFLLVFLYVLPFAALAQNITRFEYFFDTDPGFGAGTIVNVTPATTITDFNIPVSTSSLSTGFHTLYIRAQNATNQWTHTHIRSFYIVPFTASTNITQIEYFIDADPGIGLATQVSFTSASTITNLAIDISTVPLTPGFHILYVRSKSSDGKWTHTHLRSFYVANVSAAENLVKFEYFFDTDLGFDNGTSVAVTPAAPSVTNKDILADASGLSVGTHTIYIRAKDSGGEWTQVSTGSFSVTAVALPTITSFTPTSGGAGTTVTITGTNFTGATAVTFGGTAAASFTVVSSTSITAITGTGTTGKIAVTTPTGTATSTADFTFTTPDLIVISPQPISTAVCEGSTASFTMAASGTTNIIYQWQKFNGTSFIDLVNGSEISGATSSNLSINTSGNVGAGDYRCKVSGDGSQDKFSNVVTLTINPLPTAPGVTGATNCGASSLTLNASGGSNGQYRWYTTATGGTSLTGQVNNTFTTPVVNATTSYFVSINNGTCESARVEVIATILTVPTAPVVAPASNCGPGTVTLQATGGSNGQYRWYDVASGGTALAGEINSNFITPALTNSTTYYVSIHNGTCESTRTAVTAIIFTPPTKPTITSNETITAGIIQLCKNAITLTAPSGFTYTWSSGQTTQSITNVQPGNYSVVIQDGNGCSSVSSDAVQIVINTSCVNSPPIINTTTAQTFIGGKVSIDLSNLISDPDGNLDASSLQVVGNATQKGGKTTLSGLILEIDYAAAKFSGIDLVTIRVCDLLNVCFEANLEIEVVGDIIVYTGISPNGDTKNDTWVIEYITLFPDTQNNRVTIYNRWGDLVWEGANYDNNNIVFTGLNKNGNELTSGTYFYKIEFTDRETITGYLSLKR